MKTGIVKTIFAALSAVLVSLTFVVVAQANVVAQEPDRTAKAGENLQSATVLDVQAHPEGSAFDYANEGTSLTPIYDDYPYYDITLQVGDKKYVVRYDNMGGYYPTAWKVGSEVKIRKDNGKMYILRYDGVLVNTPIVQTNSGTS